MSKRAAKREKRKGSQAAPTYLFVFSSKSSMYAALAAVLLALVAVAYLGVQASMAHGDRQFERLKTAPKETVLRTPRPMPPTEGMTEPEDELSVGARETRESMEAPVIADRDDWSGVDPEALGEMFFASDAPYTGQLKPILFAESRPTFTYGRGNWLMNLACHLPKYGYLPIFDSFISGETVHSDLVADHSHHVPSDYACAAKTKEVLAMGRATFQDALKTSSYHRLPLPVIAPSWSTNSEAWSSTKNMLFTVFESPLMSREQFRRMMRYDTIFTASDYNADNIRAYGFPNVIKVRQGTAVSLFPERDPAVAQADNIFSIFSGGKFEYRKGQDLVVAAVKKFAERNPDVQVRLYAAWVNHWPRTARSMQCSKITEGFPVLGDSEAGGISYPLTMLDEKEAEAARAALEKPAVSAARSGGVATDDEDEEEVARAERDTQGAVDGITPERAAEAGEKLWDFAPWMKLNGLPENMFVSAPIMLSKELLRRIITNCDAGIFPNRAEAGTNMVASEALMSGLPLIITNTTGHQDLLRPKHPSGRPWAIPLNELQPAECNPTAEPAYIKDVAEKGWMEPFVEDIVLKLEELYNDPEGAAGIGHRAAEMMRKHDGADKRAREFAAVLNEILDSSSWSTEANKDASAKKGVQDLDVLRAINNAKARME
eukprot:TRINITY_DN8127_c0_g1_i1.p1 TRINITY_DN8127_c0_g1~~TRINITY_DN8127_c0_g1_i1.p1  ORF type:complete len:686 (+),score=232.88 TRINITY_DN8127_c0_g1_i1:80-2059(+)